MTYGQLRMRLAQQFPGVSLDLIDGWIADRYQEILGELPWSRLQIQSVLEVPAAYSTGTAAVTNGSAAITLSGGAWTSAMTGLAFRVTGKQEYYQFNYVSSITATLDRPYESETAAAAGYSIFQTIYVLPSDCRMLEDDAFGGLTRISHAELEKSDPWRKATGAPVNWASYMDDTSTPPNMQVELFPVPTVAADVPFTYYSAGSDFASAAAILSVWMQPSALYEGVVARIKAHLKDYAGATFHAGNAKSALSNMRTSEAQGMGPAQMKLDSYFTRHRARKWCR